MSISPLAPPPVFGMKAACGRALRTAASSVSHSSNSRWLKNSRHVGQSGSERSPLRGRSRPQKARKLRRQWSHQHVPEPDQRLAKMPSMSHRSAISRTTSRMNSKL